MSLNPTTQPLTNREFDIMNILWQAETPLVASEIAKRGHELTINTVQAVLKKLASKNLIKVDNIVYSGTVLTRSYTTTLTTDEFELNNLLVSFERLSNKKLTTSNFIASLLDQEKDSKALLSEIDSLQKVLDEKKKQVKDGK